MIKSSLYFSHILQITVGIILKSIHQRLNKINKATEIIVNFYDNNFIFSDMPYNKYLL